MPPRRNDKLFVNKCKTVTNFALSLGNKLEITKRTFVLSLCDLFFCVFKKRIYLNMVRVLQHFSDTLCLLEFLV